MQIKFLTSWFLNLYEDQTVKNRWLTKKKNIDGLFESQRYSNSVIAEHDRYIE